jgi:hypothetical protein
VVTALSRTLMPMVRFRTGDLAIAERREGLAVLPRGVFGRTDTMVKVKGVKLYPTELAPILAGFGLDPRGFQVVVERKLEGTDKLILRLKAEKVPPGPPGGHRQGHGPPGGRGGAGGGTRGRPGPGPAVLSAPTSPQPCSGVGAC